MIALFVFLGAWIGAVLVYWIGYRMGREIEAHYWMDWVRSDPEVKRIIRRRIEKEAEKAYQSVSGIMDVHTKED